MLEKKYLSAKEVSIYLGISIATVWRHAKNGILITYKLGSRTLFPKDDIDKLFVKK
jgi:excisionase family DNA binding protein